jgi:pentatricopeptide repeat protein
MAGARPDGVAWNALASAEAESGDPELVRSIMREAAADRHTAGEYMWVALLHSYGRAKRPDDAKTALYEELGVSPNPTGVKRGEGAGGGGKRGRHARVVGGGRRGKGSDLVSSRRVWVALAGAYAACGDVNGVKAVMSDAARLGGVKHSTELDALLIRVLCTRGHVGAAAAVADEALREGREVAARSWMLLAGGLASTGNGTASLAATEEATRRGLQPTPAVMTQVLKGFGRDCRGAEAAFAQLVKAGAQPTAMAFSALAWAYARDGTVKDVRSVLGRAEAAGFKADVALLRPLAHSLARAGDVEGVRGVHRQLRHMGNRLWVAEYSMLLSAHAVKGDVDGAIAVLDEGLASLGHAEATAPAKPGAKTPDPGSSEDAGRDPGQPLSDTGAVILFNSAIKSATAAGDVSTAVELLERMQESGIDPPESTVGGVIDTFIATGDVSGAEAFLQLLASQGVAAATAPTAKILTPIIDGWATQGDVEAAEHTMSRLLEQRGTEGPPPRGAGAAAASGKRVRSFSSREGAPGSPGAGQADVVAFGALARAYASVADWEGADRTLERCVEHGISPTDPLYMSVIAAHWRAGNSKGIVRVLQGIQHQPGPQLIAHLQDLAKRSDDKELAEAVRTMRGD